MESLLYRPADPSPSDSQFSAASPSASMGSTYDIFGFMDLPFIVNSSLNPLTDCSITAPTSLHLPPSTSSSFNHALLSHQGLPQSSQPPLVAGPPSNTFISSPVAPSHGLSSGGDVKFYHHFPPPWASLGLPMSQPFDAAAAAVANPSTRKRGCRKRPRSSRRAPVTVMVTNRCNFRAMVQEFTGVPAPPFSPPPPPPPPATRYGVFHAVPASSGWLSGDFDKHFPTLSSLLMPERAAQPGSGGVAAWSDSIVPGAEAGESDSTIFSSVMNI